MGHGSSDGENGNLYEDLSTLTTALDRLRLCYNRINSDFSDMTEIIPLNQYPKKHKEGHMFSRRDFLRILGRTRCRMFRHSRLSPV